MTKRPKRQAVDLAVLSDGLAAWSADVEALAAKARTLADLNDRAAVRAGLTELATALDALAAMLGPGAC
jgi:hypothetical protein